MMKQTQSSLKDTAVGAGANLKYLISLPSPASFLPRHCSKNQISNRIWEWSWVQEEGRVGGKVFKDLAFHLITSSLIWLPIDQTTFPVRFSPHCPAEEGWHSGFGGDLTSNQHQPVTDKQNTGKTNLRLQIHSWVSEESPWLSCVCSSTQPQDFVF